MSDDIARLQPHRKDHLSTSAKHSAELKLKLEKVATAKRLGRRYCFSTYKSSTRKQSLHTRTQWRLASKSHINSIETDRRRFGICTFPIYTGHSPQTVPPAATTWR